jgi:hypothetical protein
MNEKTFPDMVGGNYFIELNAINVSDKIEKKNGLSYLSWAYAWGELKKLHPDANYTIYENKDGWNYFTDGKTCWVKTGVSVNGLEHIEYLPVMDFKNKSIPLDLVTSFEVNKTIQRSLTKAVARHGLGLYVYAGEDLPEDNKVAVVEKPNLKQSTLNAMELFSIDINELAKYLKKGVGELTDEEVMANVERKRAKLQAK